MSDELIVQDVDVAQIDVADVQAAELSTPNTKSDTPVTVGENYVKNSDLEDPVKRLEFIKAINPKTKAIMIYKALLENGMRPLFGHNKRIYMRKLEREASKGRLDKYFK